MVRGDITSLSFEAVPLRTVGGALVIADIVATTPEHDVYHTEERALFQSLNVMVSNDCPILEEEIMGDAEFVRETIQALNSHAAELDSMYSWVMAAANNRTEIPNIRDVFQEMAEASKECDEILEIYYGDEDPLSADVRRAIQRVLDGLFNCANALVAYMAIARLTLG